MGLLKGVHEFEGGYVQSMKKLKMRKFTKAAKKFKNCAVPKNLEAEFTPGI